MTYERLDNCPLCKSPDSRNDQVISDHFLSKESFAIVRCNSCGLLFTNPRPDLESIDRYYDSPDYTSHSSAIKSLKDLLYIIARKRALRWKEQIIKKYSVGPLLLDYGAGTGEFLKYAKNRGWSIDGYEPNFKANKTASLKTGIDIQSGEINLPESKYDIITLWHVLEHIHNLDETLLALKVSLKKGGVLLLALPNHDSYDAKHYKEYWAGWDVPRHLYHFNIKSVSTLASKYGFKLLNQIPMKLDSYYVSLLSQKYLTGKNQYLKSFLLGRKSNKNARLNENYSSIIYILKNK